jgi:hypothetical protein
MKLVSVLFVLAASRPCRTRLACIQSAALVIRSYPLEAWKRMR